MTKTEQLQENAAQRIFASGGAERQGQSLMNALKDMDEELYMKITATKHDCFYEDSIVESFLRKVTAEFNK